MRGLWTIALFIFCTVLKAQDKLYFSNGTTQTGFVVSMGKDLVYFKRTDTSLAQRIKKTDLLLIESYNGMRYVFGANNSEDQFSPAKKIKQKNLLGIQPLGLLLGRGTFVYERLTDDGRIGIAIPFSVTFDPWRSLNRIDTFTVSYKSGINFMSGLDLNFYLRSDNNTTFFFGPRLRFGTDVLLLNTENYSFQTQYGIRIESERIVQHLAIGFGFLKIISSYGLAVNGRSFGSYSVTYRASLRW